MNHGPNPSLIDTEAVTDFLCTRGFPHHLGPEILALSSFSSHLVCRKCQRKGTLTGDGNVTKGPSVHYTVYCTSCKKKFVLLEFLPEIIAELEHLSCLPAFSTMLEEADFNMFREEPKKTKKKEDNHSLQKDNMIAALQSTIQNQLDEKLVFEFWIT